MSEFLHLIDREKLPRHIAVIMDGNGRWAKKYGKSRIFGHKNGVQAVKNTTESCAELGIEYLTLFAFSTENWQRPEFEVNALMALLVDSLNKEIKTLNENDIRLKAIGDVEKLPRKTYLSLMEGIENTRNNQRMTLTLALNYSARWEITKALKTISKLVELGTIDPGMIHEKFIEKHLETNGIPDPELLIRTSGERRISNFLLWQIAYTELYFTEKFWPDFKKEDLYEAIVDFQHRERRFGKISEQIRV
ncbi:MAG TPA: isoprenyl transferase [Saprospiraceae bacterium]|nr:isoprenyl transferase [Saprospiraceae bacterium]